MFRTKNRNRLPTIHSNQGKYDLNWWRSGEKVIAWSIMTFGLLAYGPVLGLVIFSSFIDKHRLFGLGMILASPIISMMIMTLFEYLSQKINKQNRDKLNEVDSEFAKFKQQWWRSDVSSEELVVSTLIALILLMIGLSCVVLDIIPDAIDTFLRTLLNNRFAILLFLLLLLLLMFGVESAMAHIIVALMNKKD